MHAAIKYATAVTCMGIPARSGVTVAEAEHVLQELEVVRHASFVLNPAIRGIISDVQHWMEANHAELVDLYTRTFPAGAKKTGT